MRMSPSCRLQLHSCQLVKIKLHAEKHDVANEFAKSLEQGEGSSHELDSETLFEVRSNRPLQ